MRLSLSRVSSAHGTVARWRAVLASSGIAGALLALTTVAEAQPKPGGSPPGPARSSTQFTLKRDGAGGADAEAARGRARSGDCAGALILFDNAIKTTIDPGLRRDRGLCHEKLAHPYPAIDDYRAYLTARPDAPDSEQIRQRLAALEEQVGVGGPSRGGHEGQGPETGGAEASASVSIGAGGAHASAETKSSVLGPKGSEPGRTYDYYVEQEKLQDAAAASPLRYGSGVVLGPFLQLPRLFVGESAPSKLAYGVGLALRYSTGPSVTLLSEIGYAGIGTSGEPSSQSGPLLMAGIEYRHAISRLAADNLLFRGGVGFERYVVSGTRAINSDVLGRFAFGYRHVWGPSIAAEVLADGGPVLVMPENASNRMNFVVGASFAVLVGF